MGAERRETIATAAVATLGILSLTSVSAAFAVLIYGFSPLALAAADLHPWLAAHVPSSWQDRDIQPGSTSYGHAMIAAVITTTLFVTVASTRVRAYSGQPFFARRRFVFFVGASSLVVALHAAFGHGGPMRLLTDVRGLLLDTRFESSLAAWVVVGILACGAVMAFSRAQARHDYGHPAWSLRDIRGLPGARRPVHLQVRGPRSRHHSGYLRVEEVDGRQGNWWSRGRDDELASLPETGDLVGELIDTAPTLIEQAMDARTVAMVRHGQTAQAAPRGALLTQGQLDAAPPIPWWVAFGRHAKRMTTPTRCGH